MPRRIPKVPTRKEIESTFNKEMILKGLGSNGSRQGYYRIYYEKFNYKIGSFYVAIWCYFNKNKLTNRFFIETLNNRFAVFLLLES